MEILTLEKTHKDVEGMYWVSAALSHHQYDNRLHVTRLKITDHEDTSRVIATDGSRLHIYDTVTKIKKGYWEVLNRRKTCVRIHRDSGFDLTKYPDNVEEMLPENNDSLISITPRTYQDAYYPFAEIVRHAQGPDAINYGYICDAMIPGEDCQIMVRGKANQIILVQKRHIAIIMPLQ